MKLLRADVLIVFDPTDNDAVIVRSPSGLESHRFNAQESYLLAALRDPYQEIVLLARYKAKFNRDLTINGLRDFIAKLDAKGLLQAAQEANNQSDEEISTDRDVSGQAYPASTRLPSAAITSAENVSNTTPSTLGQIKPNYRNHWSLFCPQRLFDLFLYMFGFARHLVGLLPLFFFFSIVGLTVNFERVRADLKIVSFNIDLLEHVFFTLFTTSLVSQILRGCIARHFGLDTPSFGLTLIFGILPRFNLPIVMGKDAPKRVKLWLLASSLLTRLILFCAGFFLWLITRSQGGGLPIFGLALALFSLISLLFVANPLMGSTGYRFLSEYFDSPNLRAKAFRALRYAFRKPPAVVARHIEDNLPLRVYALASIGFLLALIGFLATTVAGWLELHYGGVGVVIFLLFFVYLIWQFRRRFLSRQSRGRQRKTKTLDSKTIGTNSRGKMHGATEDTLRTHPYDTSVQQTGGSFLRFRTRPWGRYLLLGALTMVMFLPYRYQAGGPAQVLPIAKQGIYARHDGIIEQVFYQGGEWVTQGTVVARFDDLKQRRDIDVIQAEIEKTNFSLHQLLTTPSAAEIALADARLQTALVRLRYSERYLGRVEELHNKGSIADSTYEEAREQAELDRQAVAEQQANRLAITQQVNRHEIEAIKAELRRLQYDLSYHQALLRQTELRMPIDGRIVTMHLQDLAHAYLERGDLFAEIEDTSRVKIEIEISESDLDVVAVGDTMRLKLMLFPGRTLTGPISTIHPTSVATPYGTVVKVIAVLDNPEQAFKSGMTGFAKVDGEEMLVIAAFTRALQRFFQIEIWSWLP